MDKPTRVALALGSGGARGYAHIGAIHVVQERGLQVVGVAGSSMGAMVGGLLVAGVLDDYEAWARTLTQFDVLRLLDPSLSAPGAIRAEKVFARVHDLLGDVAIEELPLPFTAVATDLLARKEVWFQKGPLQAALRASVAIPGVVTPVMLNGRLLADGGVLNPVPIAPLGAIDADLVIAVSLAGEPTGGPADDAPARESAEERPLDEWVDRFRRGTSSLLDRDFVRGFMARFSGGSDGDRDGDGEVEAEGAADGVVAPSAEPSVVEVPAEALPAGLSKFDVMNLSIDAMQAVVTRYRLAGYPPDVLITVPKDACRSLDFHKANEMIALGRTLAEEALDRAGIPAPSAAHDPEPEPVAAPGPQD